MIKSKKDLAQYLLMDKKALGIVDEKKHPKLLGGTIFGSLKFYCENVNFTKTIITG